MIKTGVHTYAKQSDMLPGYSVPTFHAYETSYGKAMIKVWTTPKGPKVCVLGQWMPESKVFASFEAAENYLRSVG